QIVMRLRQLRIRSNRLLRPRDSLLRRRLRGLGRGRRSEETAGDRHPPASAGTRGAPRYGTHGAPAPAVHPGSPGSMCRRSRPLGQFARYGKNVRYGASFTLTPSPRRVFMGLVLNGGPANTPPTTARNEISVTSSARRRPFGNPAGSPPSNPNREAMAGGVGSTPVFSRSRSATGPPGVPTAAIGGAYVTKGSRSVLGGVGIAIAPFVRAFTTRASAGSRKKLANCASFFGRSMLKR